MVGNKRIKYYAIISYGEYYNNLLHFHACSKRFGLQIVPSKREADTLVKRYYEASINEFASSDSKYKKYSKEEKERAYVEYPDTTTYEIHPLESFLQSEIKEILKDIVYENGTNTDETIEMIEHMYKYIEISTQR